MRRDFLDYFDTRAKADNIKRDILRYYAVYGECSISELSKEMNLSVPTVTKFINDLSEEGFVVDYGKQETSGGRRPNIYGLNSTSGYFVGCDVQNNSLRFATINFNGEFVNDMVKVPFNLTNTPQSLDALVAEILKYIDESGIPKDKIINIGISLAGRINPESGYSYTLFYFCEEPLSVVLRSRLGYNVCIDNDSRTMCYGEFMKGVAQSEKNVLFINASWGLGMGMILDGRLYYGHSGFSGEIGHVRAYNNGLLCHCGKQGCLETEVSGSALHRKLLDKHNEGTLSILSEDIKAGKSITTEDMVKATLKEDVVMIELIEEIGTELGSNLANMINIFNPELVIIGGRLAETGDYLLFPIKSAIKKFSLNLVNKDSTIKSSKLGVKAGVVGACFIARNRALGIL
jgi:transcriptional regulator of PTS gene